MRIGTGAAVLAALALAGTADARPARHIINHVNVLQDLWASGTEPFWGFKMHGRQVAWSDPNESNEPMPGVLSRPRLSPGKAVWKGRLNDGRRIVITVTAGPCNDGMSDEISPLTTHVRIGDGGVGGVEGCASTAAEVEARRAREDG